MREAVVQGLTGMFRELFEGDASGTTYVVEHGPQGGMLGMLAAVDAARASRRIGSAQSIAAHTNHVMEALAAGNRWAETGEFTLDWEGTWRVQEVDGAAWNALRAALKREYEGALAIFQSGDKLSEDTFVGGLAMIGHTAYHVGAIRQLVAVQ
jgi:hypothetical protein